MLTVNGHHRQGPNFIPKDAKVIANMRAIIELAAMLKAG
jgi:hypothetical protein